MKISTVMQPGVDEFVHPNGLVQRFLQIKLRLLIKSINKLYAAAVKGK